MSKKIDATQGPLLKLIFIYTIPLILSIIAQNLFAIADKAVLGNFAGSTSVASVGATGTVTLLVINGAVGLSTGTSIILARFIGQQNQQKIRETIDTSLILSVSIGIVVAIAGFFLTPIFLTATGCPKECYKGAVIYMRIFLSAAPASLLYNYGSAILRTLGDTKKPLAYIIFAGIVNVTLNVILCLVLSNKVIAVAVATITSKIICALLVLRRLCRFEDNTKVQLLRLKFSFDSLKNILRFGIPSAISELILPVSNLQITSAINSYGVNAVAGVSAAASVNSIVNAFSAGFATATSTFIGQNLGAKNASRVKKSFWYILGVNATITGSLGILSYISGRVWLGIILGPSSKEAIEYGLIRMLFVSCFMVVSAINAVLSRSLQAFGYPLFTSISNIFFTLVFRVIWMQWIYPLKPVFGMIMACFSVSWILNMLLYAILFFFIYRRYSKKGICKKI